MSKKVKIFALVIVGLSAIIGAISFLGGGSPAPAARVGTTPGSGLATNVAVLPATGASPTAQGGTAMSGSSNSANQFSSLLSSVNSIAIDTSIFSNPAYKALRDYPVMLGTDTVGRSNPFAPIGTDSANTVAPLGVQTLAPGKITSTGAELGALVTLPDSAVTKVVFQYGVSDTFGAATPPITITTSGTTLITISNLLPSTTYMVQAVAVRGSNTTNGNTVSFTTAAASSVAPKR